MRDAAVALFCGTGIRITSRVVALVGTAAVDASRLGAHVASLTVTTCTLRWRDADVTDFIAILAHVARIHACYASLVGYVAGLRAVAEQPVITFGIIAALSMAHRIR